jgi:hypothetical protein
MVRSVVEPCPSLSDPHGLPQGNLHPGHAPVSLSAAFPPRAPNPCCRLPSSGDFDLEGDTMGIDSAQGYHILGVSYASINMTLFFTS